MNHFNFTGVNDECSKILEQVVNAVFKRMKGVRPEFLRVYLGRDQMAALMSLRKNDRDWLGIIGDEITSVCYIFTFIVVFEVAMDSHFYITDIRNN